MSKLVWRTASDGTQQLFETPNSGTTTSAEPAHSSRRQLLLDAADIIDGDRNETYGGPESSFAVIADFWSTYLDEKIEPHQVAVMLALLKLARIRTTNGKHRDSWLDLAGYAACGWEVAEEE
jgi:hypothetical protein